jgi:hypothetical protein
LNGATGLIDLSSPSWTRRSGSSFRAAAAKGNRLDDFGHVNWRGEPRAKKSRHNGVIQHGRSIEH